MKQRTAEWPPLIVVSDKPRWVAWRDAALTLAMWTLLAIMLATEFELFFGHYLERLGFGDDFNTKAHWARFFGLLEPYIWLIVMLCAMLAASTVATIHRLRRFLKAAAPPPLTVADQAAYGGMDVAGLVAARELRNAVVHVDPDGTHRVEARLAG